MTLDYRVRFVEDDDLPADHDWVMAEANDVGVVLFIKATKVTEAILEDAWAAFRVLARVPVVLPEPRPALLYLTAASN